MSASALAVRFRRRKVDALAALRALEAAGRVRYQGRGRSGRWCALAIEPPTPVPPVVAALPEEPEKQKGEAEDVQPLALVADAAARAKERRDAAQEQAREAQLAEDREASARGVATVCLAHYRGASRGRWWGPI